VEVEDLGGRFFGGEAGEVEEVEGGEALGDGVFAAGDFFEGVDGAAHILVGEAFGAEGLDLVLQFEVKLAAVGGEGIEEFLVGALEVEAELVEGGGAVGDEVEEVVEVGERCDVARGSWLVVRDGG
jgi:hypothetical protein